MKLNTYTVAFHTGNPLEGSSSSFPSDDMKLESYEAACQYLESEGYAECLGKKEEEIKGGTWTREFYRNREASSPVASIEW